MKRALLLAPLMLGLWSVTAPCADLRVSIREIRPQKGGQIVVGVFDDEASFPKTPDQELSQILTPAQAEDFIITHVPPGTYAIAVFHDENKNGKIDGFPPTEGYAFSNDARGTFGPPPFKKAKFTVSDPLTQISIRMRY